MSEEIQHYPEADTINRRLETAKGAMLYRHWDWWEIDEYIRGNHWIAYNRVTQELTNAVPDYLRNTPDSRLSVQKTANAHKTLIGFITKGDKGIVVIPIDPEGSNQSENVATDLSSFAYYLYRHLRIKQLGEDIVSFGLRRSLGAVKVYWDPKKEKGKGGPSVQIVDPYDLYFDPSATSPHEAQYIIHTSRRTLEEIKANPAYINTENLQGDNQLAESTARTLELQVHYPTINNPDDGDDDKSKKLDTAIVKEMWEKRLTGKGQVEIWVSTCVGTTIIREPEKTEFDRFPFEFYRTDHNPQEVWGEGAMKMLVPINRVIDRIESQIADYNNTFLKGSYKADSGGGVKVINNKSGKVFVIKRGFMFEQLAMQDLPDTIFKQLENWINYHDETSGINQAMVGEKPVGTRTGVEIEALQEAGTNNLSTYITNYNFFLEDLFTALFKLCARHYTTTRTHAVGTLFNNLQLKSYIGAKSKVKNLDAIMVPDNIHITISPDNLIGFTQSARFDRVMQLFKEGALDQQAVLELLAIDGYQNIITRMEQRRQQQQKEQAQQQQQQIMMEQQAKNVPAPPKVNLNLRGELNPIQSGEVLETQGINPSPGIPSDVNLAMNENNAMMNGVNVLPTPNPSPAHTLTHLEHMKRPEYRVALPHVDQKFLDHIMGEDQNNRIAKQNAMRNAMAMSVSKKPS